jgi:hypothetical protein
MPIASPPMTPKAVNIGTMTIAQMIPSIRMSSVPSTNNSVATHGAQK